MNAPKTFSDVIENLRRFADRWESGHASPQEIYDALVCLEGARKVINEFRAAQALTSE